jgi:hypothetical protein
VDPIGLYPPPPTIPIKKKVKEDVMSRTCSTHVEKRNTYGSLMGKPEGNRPVGRPRHRWEDNIYMGLTEIR